MQFAISIPQHVPDGAFDPGAMRGYLARAEELDFASAWTQEQILGAIPQLGPVETLTYAAACTDRIRLGCAVFITSLHSPVHLAKSLSTLDQLSLGRLEVGIGTGGPRRRVHKVARETVTLDLLSSGRLTLGVGLGGQRNGELEPFGEHCGQRG